MTLYSSVFLFGFLPISAVLYYTVKGSLRTYCMCVLSLVFYVLSVGEYFFVLPVLALLVYALSFCGKWGFYICLCLLPLIRLLGLCNFGVSFFILRGAAYIYDGYKDKNFANVFSFLCFFPTLGAGPITHYGDIRLCTAPDFNLVSVGILRLICGCLKKLLLADNLKSAFDIFFDGGTSLSAVAAVITYSLYIYFDFSGYSDCAVGVCNIFSVSIGKNFDFPYMAKSVGEFFRRWHISLGRWLFKYIYVPLGGSRLGKARTVISLFFVWLASALWHGSAWSYLLWGAWFFCFSVIEKLGYKLFRISTLLVIAFGWVFFFCETPYDIYCFWGRLFALGDTLLYSRADIYNCLRYLPFVLLCSVLATPVFHRLLCNVYSRARCIVYIFALPALWIILSCLASGGHSPFLYQGF